MKKPILIYPLILLILFVSIGALFGGFSLISDPSGSSLKLPENYLKDSFFKDYFIPGIILFSVLGVIPLILIYGIFMKNSLNFLNKFRVYKDLLWQWNFLVYYGFGLIIWINVQIMFVPYFILQPIISLIGVLIIVLTFFNSIREYYKF